MATTSEALIYDPGLLAEQLGAATPNNPVATQADLANLAGGAPQWVAGAQKEGALVYNAGYVYRVKQDIANGQTAPTATTAFYLQLAYDDTSIYALARGVRDRVDALDRNVIRWNRPRRITIPSGGGNPSYVSGDAFVVFAASTSGSSSLFTLTAQDYPRQGDYLSIQVRADSVPLTVKGLPFGSAAGPNTVTFAPGLLYELHAATDSTTDSTANYWVVHSTPSTGSGTPGPTYTAGDGISISADNVISLTDTRDPFAVGDNAAITSAVLDLSNTWVKGDLTAFGSDALRNAGAPPAISGQNSSILVGTADVATMDEFDKTDANGNAWRCRYSRRNDGTSGWTRLGKTS